MHRSGAVRDSIEMVEVNQVEGVSMLRKLPVLLLITVLFASISMGTLSLSSNEVAAAPPLPALSWTFSITGDGTVKGQVKDEGNNTVAGAEVTLRSGDMVVVTTSTDDDGAFSITAPNGKYNLTISKQEIVSFTVPVDIVSGEELDLGVIEVEQAPDYQWIVIDIIIIIGAIGLFWVGKRNQRLGKR